MAISINYSSLFLQTQLDSCIFSLVKKTAIGFEAKVTNCQTKALKIFGDLFIGAIALGSKLPFINPNLQLPVPFPLQITCATTNFASWLIFECDNGWKVIDSILTKPSDEEVFLQKRILPSAQALKTALKVLSVGIALVSQVPLVYQAMDFNSKKLAGPIVAFVLIAGAIFPTRSLFLSVDRLFNQFQAKPDLVKAQTSFLQLIEANQKAFEKNPDKAGFIKALKEIAQENTEENLKKKLYLEKLLSQVTSLTSLESAPRRTLLNTAAMITGLFLTVNHEIYNALYAFTGTQNYLSKNVGVASTFSAMVILSTTYLTGLVIIDLTRQTFNYIADLWAGKKYESIAEQFYGRRIKGCQAITAATSLFSVGAYYEIVRQYFAGDPLKQSYFTITACIPMFILLQASANSFIQEQTEYWGFSKGERKDILETLHLFQDLSKLVREMDPDNMELFTSLLPTSVLNTIGLQQPSDIEMNNISDQQSGTDLSSLRAEMGDSTNSSPFPEQEFPHHPERKILDLDSFGEKD